MTGAYSVAAVYDGAMSFHPRVMFPTSTEEQWARSATLLEADGTLVMPYGGYLIAGRGDRLLLIDVGGGPEYSVPAGRAQITDRGRLPESLRALGCEPGDISDVIFTHLHFDHVGWASRDEAAFFPNATLWCHQLDWDYFVPASGAAPQAIVPELLEPVRDRVQTWSGSIASVAGIELWHTPGHSPGSCIALVPREKGTLAIIGDLVHTPAEFTADWPGLADADPELGLATRHRIGGRLATLDIDVCGPHFPQLDAGRLREHEGRFSWDPSLGSL
jgi:glyoxylase-like metal-dependent hydrolase (beta-lactamase superfamily II)